MAHASRVEAAAASRSSHAVVLGVLALGSALDSGAPLARPAAALRSGCGNDPLVVAALASLPSGKEANKGIPTRYVSHSKLRVT